MDNSCISAYFHRPRCLHAAIFAYYVLTGGRFTAPFLETVAGFSETTVGLALAMQVALDAVLGPLAGSIADAMELRYRNKGRAMVMTLGVLVGTIAFTMHSVVSRVCGTDTSMLACGDEISTTLHFALRALYSIANSFTYPILNGITLAYLEDSGNTSDYGRERLYGAISWAVASVVVGFAIDQWGLGCYWVFALVGCSFCLLSIVLFVDGLKEKHCIDRNNIGSANDTITCRNENASQESSSFSLLKLLSELCLSIYGFGFIVSLVSLKMGMSIVESLIFIFFEELGGSFSLMGLTVVVTVIFEIPIFHVSDKLLDRFGPGRLQQIACVAYIIRVFGYTLIPSGQMAWVLIVEPLHGVTIGCASTSSVEYMAQLAPKGYEASGQGLLSGIGGLGSIVGLSLGGYLEEHVSSVFMYRVYAVIVSIGLSIFLFTDAWRGRYRKLQSKSSDVFDDNATGSPENTLEIELPTAC